MLLTIAVFCFLSGFVLAVLSIKSPKATRADATRFFNNVKAICCGLWHGTSLRANSVADDARKNELDIEQGTSYLLTKYASIATREQ